jgi:hypothetical protein
MRSPRLFIGEIAMEVHEQIVMECLGWGFCIAAFDEESGDFARVSEEFYLEFEAAQAALMSGDWTPA